MEQKIQPKAAVGYAVTSVAEGGMYQFVNGFLLMYLTSVVGIGTDKAAVIVSVGMAIETFTGLVIGKLSDSCTSPRGRRRPFLLLSSVVMPLTMIAVFINYGGVVGGSALIWLYMILNILLWSSHALFYIPNMAFGAEIATDYDDRTKIRSLCSAMGAVGTFLGSAAPLMIVSLFQHMGSSDSWAWFFTCSFIAVVTGISLFFGWKLTAGVEQMPPGGRFDPAAAIRDIPLLLMDYWQLMKLKCMQILLVFKVAFNVGYAFFTSAMIFFIQYRLGFGNEVTSTIYTLQIIINFLSILLMSWVGLKLGKAGTLRLTLSIAAVGCILFYVTGIHSYASLVLYIVVFSVASNSFWQLSGAVFYDITEVDEFVFGKRREGAIISLQSGIGSLATSAIVAWFGAYLKGAGFDAALATQPQTAMVALDRLFILMPGICFAIGCAVIFFYPLNKKRFGSLQSALHLKRKGKEYSQYQADLDRIL